jgi:hypothetical protein
MFNKISRVFRTGGVTTGFEAYLNNVRRQTGQYGPTMDEAKKDYKSMSSRRFGNLS